MQNTITIAADLKDRNNNTAIRIECFPEAPDSDVSIVRTTNFIYGNVRLKKYDTFKAAMQAFDKNLENTKLMLNQLSSEALIFKNAFRPIHKANENAEE